MKYIPLWNGTGTSIAERILFGLPKLRTLAAYLWTRGDIRATVTQVLEEAQPHVLWLDLFPMIYHLRLAASSPAVTVMGTYDAEPLRRQKVAAAATGSARVAIRSIGLLE
ncbi:MAG: hypothetical protein GTN93_32300, partial [Anaerolineae bacterium]|nr:hypothetical protein [Anaerolineae bacterium]